jgi:anti-sigma regulatory factor (Ser/Thr protein kinase)
MAGPYPIRKPERPGTVTAAGAQERCLLLDGSARCVAMARQHVTIVLDGWCLTDEVVDDAGIVVSELASNAVKHGGGASSVRLYYSHRHVTVAVTDRAPTILPVVPTESGPLSGLLECGRGLAIVRALAGT